MEYMVTTSNTDRDTAVLLCEQSGAVLASPSTGLAHEFVGKLVAESGNTAWIGLKNHAVDRTDVNRCDLLNAIWQWDTQVVGPTSSLPLGPDGGGVVRRSRPGVLVN